MFSALFFGGVRLDLGTGVVRVRSPRALETALRARTSPTSMRIAALASLADESLLREAEALRELEQRIARALADASDSGNAVAILLSDIDIGNITEDHGWRLILRSVHNLDAGALAYKRTALLKFMEYLGSGQEMIRTLRANRAGGSHAERGGAPSANATQDDLTPRQSLVFDLHSLSAAKGAEPEREEFNRLPKGDTLEVELGQHQSLTLMLARHRFALVSGDPYLLLDEHGNDLRLRRGKNIVGRSVQCDVAIDPIFRAVSRKHLIVESTGADTVKITDISTLGTFVPREYLDNKLH